ANDRVAIFNAPGPGASGAPPGSPAPTLVAQWGAPEFFAASPPPCGTTSANCVNVLDSPLGLGIDPSSTPHSIYAADNSGNRILKFTNTGNYLTKIGTEFAAVPGFPGRFDVIISQIAVDPAGNAFFIDLGNNKVYEY